MKKFLLTLTIVLLSATSSIATTLYTATSVACSIKDSNWSDWSNLGCLFVMDQDAKQIRIYSDISYSTYTNKFSIDKTTMQIIDYGAVETSYGVNSLGYSFRLETIPGNDKNGVNCVLYFYIFDDGDLMFLIKYSDISYKYMLKRQ